MLTIPGRCWLCHLFLACPSWGLCSRCSATFPPPLSVCPQCGLPALSERLSCGRCLLSPPEWDRLIYVADYQPPLRDLIHDLKFNGIPALAPTLARLLLLSILYARREHQLRLPDIILGVPLHQRRIFWRGYNQSALIATSLSHWLGCRYEHQAIRRIQARSAQHQLSARQRQFNLKGAFRVEIPVTGLHIALVDDVVTTGNTVAEIARLLKKQGAATVQVWCLCRTL